MKKIFIVLLFSILSSPLFSQTWEQIKENRNVYLCGEGRGETVDEADKQALANLVSQISVSIESDFTITEEEKKKMEGDEYSRYVENKIKTYSSATLSNTTQIIIKNEPDAIVGRYIKKSEIDRIYESRKAKVAEYVSNAVKAEKLSKVDDALRNFYWAYSLLKTIPHSADLKYKDSTGVEHSMIVWIPNEMNEIFDNIKADVVSREGIQLQLHFAYKGKPVESLDYTYFDGVRWCGLYSAKSGKGVLELARGALGENIQLKYEYAYKGEAHIDREIETVLNTVVGTSMRKSYVTVNGEVNRAVASAVVKSERTETNRTYANVELVDDQYIQDAMARVVEAIRTKNYSSVNDLFTEDGLLMFNRLMVYGNGSILGVPNIKIIDNGESRVVRSVPMAFSCPGNVRKSFVENIVFTFVDGKIDCLAFALDDKAVKDILGNEVWSPKAKMIIIEFLENYKTAFALERVDYLETIFHDDAVIFTAKIVKRVKSPSVEGNSFGNMTEDQVVKQKMTKQQYINHLKRSFASKEFINIRFSENNVEKAGRNTEVYGLQIKQDYFSNNYGDTGYLFLLVDINNPKEPTIRVRTWQPKPDFELDKEDGIIDMWVL